MAARPLDIFGGTDYGKWKLWSVLPIPFNTPALPNTDIPGAIPLALASAWGISSGVAFPAAPAAGDRFYRTDLGRLYVYTGTIWVPGIPIAETGILRVIVSENTGVGFNLNLTRGYGTAAAATSLMSFNTGVALTANALHMFDVPVIRGDIVNFQFAFVPPPITTTILMLDAYLVITMGP